MNFHDSSKQLANKDQFYEDTLCLQEERAHDVLCELAAEPMHMDFEELDKVKDLADDIRRF